ncbi:MAG TPA: DUF3018 family protein [Gammaproteobacteria bacterium]|nr:DUF3018 family protein [Gammaproteobacteria bacterium]
MMGASTLRVRKHRANLRAAGFKPVQIWVPDTTSDKFEVECRRQSMLAAEADRKDHELMDFLDAGFADLR